jgi:hypothetical protein
MTFRRMPWLPIAVVLGGINLVGAAFAAGSAEPMHAAGHTVLALAFGLWAQRLGQRRGGSESQAGIEGVEPGLEGMEAELGSLRSELSEMQERMDFVERLLARDPEMHRLRPEPGE